MIEPAASKNTETLGLAIGLAKIDMASRMLNKNSTGAALTPHHACTLRRFKNACKFQTTDH
jgi:hypothetical protein